MKKLIPVLVLVCSVAAGDTIEDRVTDLESRVQHLESLHGIEPEPEPDPEPDPNPQPGERLPTLTHHRIPDWGVEATLTTVQSGEITDPVTWGGRIPVADDVCVVASGHTVAANTDCEFHSLCVHGTLETSARLSLMNLLVYADGTLVNNPGTFVWFRPLPLDTGRDPEQYGRGLINLGDWQINGTYKTPWVRTDVSPQVGDTTVSLEQAVEEDWLPGDEIIVPCTLIEGNPQTNTEGRRSGVDFEHARSASERRTITAIDGATVTFDRPLEWPHSGALDGWGNEVLRCHVFNLTRDVHFESDPEFGGHTLSAHMATAHHRAASFKGLHRTTIAKLDSTTFDADGNVLHIGENQIARYPWHLHHVGGRVDQWSADNIVVDGGDDWHFSKQWIVAHQSHFGDVTNSIVYNSAGSCFVTEDGPERDIRFLNNAAIRCKGVNRFHDDAYDYVGELADSDPGDSRGNEGGDGLWLKGIGNCTIDGFIAYDLYRAAVWPADEFPHHKMQPPYEGAQREEYVDYKDAGRINFAGPIRNVEAWACRFLENSENVSSRHLPIHLTDLVFVNGVRALNMYHHPYTVERCKFYGDPTRDIRIGDHRNTHLIHARHRGTGVGTIRDIECHNWIVGLSIRQASNPATLHVSENVLCVNCFHGIGMFPLINSEADSYTVILNNCRVEEGDRSLWTHYTAEQWDLKSKRVTYSPWPEYPPPLPIRVLVYDWQGDPDADFEVFNGSVTDPPADAVEHPDWWGDYSNDQWQFRPLVKPIEE